MTGDAAFLDVSVAPFTRERARLAIRSALGDGDEEISGILCVFHGP